MTTLPTERTVFQFDHATVVYTSEHSAATGRVMPKLYIQAIDAYSYQWELTIQFRHRPGDSKDLYWEGHIYRHPGIRNIQTIQAVPARRMILRILELCQNYPTLLFTTKDSLPTVPRHDGFVHMAIPLLHGAEFSKKMLP